MRPRAAGVKHLTHEEKTQTACVLRLFGMPAAAVRQAAQAFAAEGTAVRCRSRGAETLLALQAETPAQLEKARKALQRQFAAQLYGEGETTLAAATVQALEAHKKLLVCADAAAGALLETRLETVAVAEKVFDFGAMSYADEKIRAKLDAKTRRVKGGPAAMALARVQAVLRLVGTDLAAGCVERAEDTVLFVGSRRGCWVRGPLAAGHAAPGRVRSAAGGRDKLAEIRSAHSAGVSYCTWPAGRVGSCPGQAASQAAFAAQALASPAPSGAGRSRRGMVLHRRRPDRSAAEAAKPWGRQPAAFRGKTDLNPIPSRTGLPPVRDFFAKGACKMQQRLL